MNALHWIMVPLISPFTYFINKIVGNVEEGAGDEGSGGDGEAEQVDGGIQIFLEIDEEEGLNKAEHDMCPATSGLQGWH